MSSYAGIAARIRENRPRLYRNFLFQLAAFILFFGLILFVGSFMYRTFTSRSGELRKHSLRSETEVVELSKQLRMVLDSMSAEFEKEVRLLQSVELTDSSVTNVIGLNETKSKLFSYIQFNHEKREGIVHYASQPTDMSDFYNRMSIDTLPGSVNHFHNLLDQFKNESKINGISLLSKPRSFQLISIFPVMTDKDNSVGLLWADLPTWRVYRLFSERRSYLNTSVALIDSAGHLLSPDADSLRVVGDLVGLSDSTGNLFWAEMARIAASSDTGLTFLADVGGDEGSYLHVKPVGFHDLFIMTVAPAKLIFKNFEELTKVMQVFRLAGALLAAIGAVGVIIIVVITVTYSQYTDNSPKKEETN